MPTLEDIIKQSGCEVGFDLIGIASAQVPPEAHFFKTWIEAGYKASMDYLSRRVYERFHPEKLLPGVKSIIACGVSYNTCRDRSVELQNDNRVWVSRYAWGDDYHPIVQEMLSQLVRKVTRTTSNSFHYKTYVDTGPVLERVYAYRAGLGWFGKNSCLLHQEYGSYFFIGIILTDLQLSEDQPQADHCGTCTRCIDACPTGAIVNPKVIDSNRCISFQTIENHDDIPKDIRDKMGNQFFGCDICQEVCPWNRKALLSNKKEFEPRQYFFKPQIDELWELIKKSYPESFRNSPLKRAKKEGLFRNLMIAMGNSQLTNYASLLNSLNNSFQKKLSDTRDWALEKILK